MTNEELNPRKRLEIIIDQPHLERVLECLDAAGIRGHTVVPCTSGRGTRGAWVPDPLTSAESRAMVLAVGSEASLAKALPALRRLFIDYPGVAFVSDVWVLRPERF